MEKWTCWFCGTKSAGATCPVCEADLDAQREEMAALNAEARLEQAVWEAEDPDMYSARASAEAHLDGIRDDLTPEQYAAELDRLTESEYQRLRLEEWIPDEDETTDC